MERRKIILASGSPRRRELLKQIGQPFEVYLPEVEEDLPRGLLPEEYAMGTARKKAEAVMARCKENETVLAADTVVVLEGELLEKPPDRRAAVEMLQKLSGRRHEVVTGCAITRRGEVRTFYERTDVYMRELTSDEIEEYVEDGEPLDKAGAYGIQGKGAAFIWRIEGDYYNVVGLPLCRLMRELKSEEFLQGKKSS